MEPALPSLNQSTLSALEAGTVSLDALLALPERILQFGTGAFLRGFADYFVDRANRNGVFNGRVVMVGSTGSGRTQSFNNQDGLYTLLVRGQAHGAIVDQQHVITSVSRALSSREQWPEVLACAHNPDVSIIISNTTEVGITYDATDQLSLTPPRSFPGKLTAWLYERARAFMYDPTKGIIVLPCELIENNGAVLFDIVQRLATQWNLGAAFLRWLNDANTFHNTLVDRIVPGTPPSDEAADLQNELGYQDDLLTVAEPYRLWAIEGNGTIKSRFPLAGIDPGVVVTDNIAPFRERKVRILNGAHTVSVPLALLCGFEMVGDAVGDDVVGEFIRQAVHREIVPSLDSDRTQAEAFGEAVIDRFSNPFIQHKLLDITFQQTMKLRVRVLPSLLAYTRKHHTLPPALTFGFACFLLLQHPTYRPAGLRTDDAAAYWHAIWKDVCLDDEAQVQQAVTAIAQNAERWGTALDALPGFVDRVTQALVDAARLGVPAALETHVPDIKR